MKPKLLTKRQQLGIFNCADPVSVMRAYVSYSPDVLFIAQKRMHTASLDKFIKRCQDDADKKEFTKRYHDENQKGYIEDFIRKCKAERKKLVEAGKYVYQDPTTETQKQMFLNLSEKDAIDIFFNMHGHIYQEVLIKILDAFPKEVSKELLLEYGKHCAIYKEVLIRAISVLGEDAKEIIYTQDYLSLDLFNKMYRVFGKEKTKEIIIEHAGIEHNPHNLDICDDVELKLIKLYSKEDLRDFLKCFVKNNVPMEGELFTKIFDVFSSKEEIEKLLDSAIADEMCIWYETLDKIVEYFPREEAKAYLDKFFETGPGSDYSDEEIEKYYNRLLTDEERAALEDDDDDY